MINPNFYKYLHKRRRGERSYLLFYDSLSPPPSNKLRSLVSFFQEKYISIIIGCDSNSNHVIWSSTNRTNTNSRRVALKEYLYGPHLEILNQGDEPTFVTRIRQEVIDNTLASSDIKREIYYWRVTTEVSYYSYYPRKPFEYMNPHPTDWEHFSNELACSIRGCEKDTISFS
jgi:hypothetical protein